MPRPIFWIGVCFWASLPRFCFLVRFFLRLSSGVPSAFVLKSILVSLSLRTAELPREHGAEEEAPDEEAGSGESEVAVELFPPDLVPPLFATPSAVHDDVIHSHVRTPFYPIRTRAAMTMTARMVSFHSREITLLSSNHRWSWR